MKLLRLSYQDLSSGLSIDSCKFFPDLNLLVGISGAGKTSILKAISNLKRIANGESINGVKWDVELLTNDHVRYHWLGEFEVRKARSLIKIEEDEVNEIISFIDVNKKRMRELSLRTVLKVADLRKSMPDRWQRVATLSVMKH
jgi:ABC-type multidrug transport system ATPase subunit